MSKKSRNQSNRKAGFAYYVREGLSSVFVHGFTSLAAMLVIAACLMITGIFSLVAYNIDLQIRELEGKEFPRKTASLEKSKEQEMAFVWRQLLLFFYA